MANFNVFTYLVSHNDENEGNYLISGVEDNPRVFSVDNGLAFDNIGSIVTQTAAGYTGTGTHGSGTPLLSTFIEEMRLVDGEGVIHELRPNQEAELFSASLPPCAFTPSTGAQEASVETAPRARRETDAIPSFRSSSAEYVGSSRSPRNWLMARA